jgi:hypothetical protein
MYKQQQQQQQQQQQPPQVTIIKYQFERLSIHGAAAVLQPINHHGHSYPLWNGYVQATAQFA